MRRLAIPYLYCLLSATLIASCAALGPIDDGTSVAYGFVNGGMLLRPVQLPVRGDGYEIPPLWAKRGNNFGTDEMVGLIVRAARRVERESPGAVLYVADLSPKLGGASLWHKSHQTGRDADLMFFTRDAKGNPSKRPSSMWLFDDTGNTHQTNRWGKKISQPKLVFDVERNWLLVRALLEDPVVDIQYLFVSEGLKQLLLAHAEQLGEPNELVKRARAILHQPGGGALPHNDHIHLRVYCAPGDRIIGCKDKGPLRWFKKSYKYLEARRLTVPAPRYHVAARPFCQMLSRGAIAGL